jgi:hypothetical protein
MERTPIPTQEEFLAAPHATIAKVAPATLILGAGGTRRRAVLEGLSPTSREYMEWSRRQMVACLDLIFQHGVQHIITPVLVEGHAREVTAGYQDQLVAWITAGLTGKSAQEDYRRLGWRVRLIGTEAWPELVPVAQELAQATAAQGGPTVWFSVIVDREASWQRVLTTAAQQQITARKALIRAIYGEDIPPATLLLGTGKPLIDESLAPALLIGKLECYWRQHLGYDLDQTTLRTILYDYAYLRSTWRADKTGRAESVVEYAQAWENPPVIGLGTRLGPFWYPAPIRDVNPD